MKNININLKEKHYSKIHKIILLSNEQAKLLKIFISLTKYILGGKLYFIFTLY